MVLVEPLTEDQQGGTGHNYEDGPSINRDLPWSACRDNEYIDSPHETHDSSGNSPKIQSDLHISLHVHYTRAGGLVQGRISPRVVPGIISILPYFKRGREGYRDSENVPRLLNDLFRPWCYFIPTRSPNSEVRGVMQSIDKIDCVLELSFKLNEYLRHDRLAPGLGGMVEYLRGDVRQVVRVPTKDPRPVPGHAGHLTLFD